MAIQESATPQAVGEITNAATAFVSSLNADQKAKATFEYLDGERVFWYYPPMNRHGLALRDMGPRNVSWRWRCWPADSLPNPMNRPS